MDDIVRVPKTVCLCGVVLNEGRPFRQDNPMRVGAITFCGYCGQPFMIVSLTSSMYPIGKRLLATFSPETAKVVRQMTKVIKAVREGGGL